MVFMSAGCVYVLFWFFDALLNVFLYICCMVMGHFVNGMHYLNFLALNTYIYLIIYQRRCKEANNNRLHVQFVIYLLCFLLNEHGLIC